jgi:hypothetical protein
MPNKQELMPTTTCDHGATRRHQCLKEHSLTKAIKVDDIDRLSSSPSRGEEKKRARELRKQNKYSRLLEATSSFTSIQHQQQLAAHLTCDASRKPDRYCTTLPRLLLLLEPPIPLSPPSNKMSNFASSRSGGRTNQASSDISGTTNDTLSTQTSRKNLVSGPFLFDLNFNDCESL